MLYFFSFPSQVVSIPLIFLVKFLFELILSYFRSENLNLYKIKLKTIGNINLNVSINYLSNIKCNKKEKGEGRRKKGKKEEKKA